ncbi:HpaA family protein [Sulfurimonas sp. HSL-3221]|uniref:HpaA family protein n=1 Tax=Sulfurimonadaceae TaxID=2771471 RepID=UPI001E61A03B|nr:HpaA family protein [Sulfurimonas sp. HSL-3221]UFS63301.1 HpaA family protein [Sulfurimonas sp. HSL-3221]
MVKTKLAYMFAMGIAGILVSSLMSGCSTKIPVKKEVGTLNLQNVPLARESATNETIAIVSPEFAKNAAVQQTANRDASPLALMMQAQMQRTNINYSFSNAFQTGYSQRLKSALETSISEILTAKGFTLKGPYSVFDDMTYGEKKTVYLACIPKINLVIDKKITDTNYADLYYEENGVIQIGGNVVVTMMEPMTGQVFMKRRINLSDFNIAEPYIYAKQTSQGGNGLTNTAIEKMTAPDELVDTTDVALTNAINKFYAQTVQKLQAYLDREEILSYQPDVENLKGLKRY